MAQPAARRSCERAHSRARIVSGRKAMPIILWLLGVPLGIVILLWLLHVV
jgi:hypothetical protein